MPTGLKDVAHPTEEAIGHVAEGEVEPGGGDDEGTTVRKGLETQRTVVMAHAGLSDSTEGQMGIGYVHDGVVDAGTARSGATDEVSAYGYRAEIVEGKGFLALTNETDGFVGGAEGNHRENGTEYLVGHDGGIGSNIGQQGGFDIALGDICLTPGYNTAIGQVGADTLEGAVVDETDVVGTQPGIVTVETSDFVAEGGDEIGLEAFVDEQIVGGNTGLSGIEGLAPGDAAGSDAEIGTPVDNAGALTTEFEDDGSEVTGCGLHDLTAKGGTAGEEDKIETAFQEGGVDLAVTLYDSYERFVKAGGDEIGQYLGDVGHVR